MIKAQITDGGGTGLSADVQHQALVVTESGFPPILTQKSRIWLSEFLNAAGSNDMGIDGSATAVDFYISANDVDRYITSVSFLVGYGSSAGLWEFADSGVALTNGFRFYYERSGERVDIHAAIKKNSDLIGLCVGDILLANWEVRHLGANNDYGYLCRIDFLNMMPAYGLKLEGGSSQKIVFEVRDDNTDADTMFATAYGFERIE